MEERGVCESEDVACTCIHRGCCWAAPQLASPQAQSEGEEDGATLDNPPGCTGEHTHKILGFSFVIVALWKNQTKTKPEMRVRGCVRLGCATCTTVALLCVRTMCLALSFSAVHRTTPPQHWIKQRPPCTISPLSPAFLAPSKMAAASAASVAGLLTSQASRCVVVTGAGSGIGKGVSEFLAKAGHTLVVTDLDGAAADAVASGIVKAGGVASGHELNVADEASVEALRNELQSRQRPAQVCPVKLLFSHLGASTATHSSVSALVRCGGRC